MAPRPIGPNELGWTEHAVSALDQTSLNGAQQLDAVFLLHGHVRNLVHRSIGLYGMSRYRFDAATDPPQLVVGFGNTNEHAINNGIAAIADLTSATPPPARPTE